MSPRIPVGGSPVPPAGFSGGYLGLVAAWPRVELLAAFALSLWILFLHGLFLFHAGPLWRDEVGTIDFACFPTLSDLWQHLQYDNFPPLFVGLARLWTRAGLSGDFNYRLLGFVIGAGTLGIFWLAARAGGARAPLLALALYAANPLAVRVGDAMRPYGLGYALALPALVLTWKFVEKPSWQTWLWAAFASLLSVQCLYQNAFLLAAFGLAGCGVALARRQGKTLAQTAALGVVAALSLLPHLPNIIKGRDWQGIGFHRAHPAEILTALLQALNSSGPWMVWCWAALALLALAAALLFAIRSRDWRMFYFGAALLAAVFFYGLFLEKVGLQQRSWYFLLLLAPAALAIDIILAAPAAPKLRLGRAGLALLLTASSIPAGYAAVQVRQSNADLVAEALRQQARPGDMILVSPWYYGVALQRYYTNHFDTLPPMDLQAIRIHRYDLMKKQMMAEDPIGPLLAKARQTLRSTNVLWIVGDFRFPPPGQPQPLFPPYREDLVMDVAAAWYFSSWMFQFSQMVQAHVPPQGQAQVVLTAPGNAPINGLEDMLLLQFRGWKD
jgi:hypothetical protein